jgi:hypothetical protein
MGEACLPLVIVQASLVIAIFSRGAAVRPALVAGGVFSIVGALTGGRAETVGYAILALIHFRLASKRAPLSVPWLGYPTPTLFSSQEAFVAVGASSDPFRQH